MGGLARRASYIKALKLRSSNSVPVLFVDAGNLFSDERYAAGELPAAVAIKNRWVAKSGSQFLQHAANLTHYDLPFLGELLKKDGYEKRLEEYPFISKLVSANVRPATDLYVAPQPYVITEITLTRGSNGKKLRIGIVGFTELKPIGAQDFVAEYAGFRLEDPFQAAKRVLPELKQKVDHVVALAYMTQENAQRLANENAEIDTIIGARQLNATNDLQRFNQATIAYGYNQTKYLGELRFYVNGDGKIENRVNRFVALDDAIPDEPTAAEVVAAAHNEFTTEQNKSAQQAISSAAPAVPGLMPASNSPYAGGDTCAGCHTTEHDIWKKSGHSHAMATLEARNQQFDTACVKCHVVGFESGGFQALYSTPQFANVQCESCHGPGRQHAENPAKGYGHMPTPAGCVVCHTKVNSPDFDFKTYWPKVKH
jgi:2',3'-cyclic-nucleotide 2'-phosphodiesterase (5'-nucleotidase family)